MTPVVTIYEVILEITPDSAEVFYHTHQCRELPRSYKGHHATFLKEKEEKVTKLFGSVNHIKLKAWTKQELHIPEMHEYLHIAAVKEITRIQQFAQRMYDQNMKINRDTPALERGLGWRA